MGQTSEDLMKQTPCLQHLDRVKLLHIYYLHEKRLHMPYQCECINAFQLEKKKRI